MTESTHSHVLKKTARDPAKAQALADKLGSEATVGSHGARPAGDIVMLAVPYSGVTSPVADFGESLTGKTNVDISNPVAPDLKGLVSPVGSSGAQEIAMAARRQQCHVIERRVLGSSIDDGNG